MLNTLSIEYLLYACDDDYALVEKLCKRLNGLRLWFSTDQLNRIKVHRMLLEGKPVKDISIKLDMSYGSVWMIKKRMLGNNLTYYCGDDNGEKQTRNS